MFDEDESVDPPRFAGNPSSSAPRVAPRSAASHKKAEWQRKTASDTFWTANTGRAFLRRFRKPELLLWPYISTQSSSRSCSPLERQRQGGETESFLQPGSSTRDLPLSRGYTNTLGPCENAAEEAD
jgi:hypothetical protein